MKYCIKCGAPMNDDSLFCPKCGTKVEEIIEEKSTTQPAIEKSTPNDEAPKTNARVKGARVPIYEEKVKQFLPVPLTLIVASIVIWIINAVGHPTGIGKVAPLLLFIFMSAFYAVMSMIRAIKTLTRKIYFKSVLSFVLFALLFTCIIIDVVFLTLE